MTYQVDTPGRGAWTTVGGLLPLTPTNKDPYGYWRAPAATEVMIGRPYFSAPAAPTKGQYTQLVIHEATRALQRLLGVTDDGLFGPASAAAGKAKQAALGVVADGVIGPTTMRQLLVSTVTTSAKSTRVPIDHLGGVAVFESGLDLAAVGINGADTGLCQINMAASGAKDITVAQATDPAWALNWSGLSMRAVYDRWNGPDPTTGKPKTKADPWDIAVANHNSPALAQEWARDGKPPFSQSRKDHGFPQIDEYVASALAAWTN